MHSLIARLMLDGQTGQSALFLALNDQRPVASSCRLMSPAIAKLQKIHIRH